MDAKIEKSTKNILKMFEHRQPSLNDEISVRSTISIIHVMLHF